MDERKITTVLLACHTLDSVLSELLVSLTNVGYTPTERKTADDVAVGNAIINVGQARDWMKVALSSVARELLKVYKDFPDDDCEKGSRTEKESPTAG